MTTLKKILFIAKVNQIVKEIHEILNQHYRVQLCNYNADIVMGMMELIEPDLVLISLIGFSDLDTSVYSSMHLQYPDTPVFTIGDESEARHFARYYVMDQFENLTRPISGMDIVNAIDNRLKNKDSADNIHLLNDESSTPATPSIFDNFPLDELEPKEEKEPEKDRKNILVVDDNAGTLRSIKSMLENDYDVSVAPSGIKAMTMLGRRRPDLIILDYDMPVVDGRQTLEMIRSEEDFADIPVLFLTGVNNREQIQAVLSLNPAGYLLKPPNQTKLLDAIGKALRIY